MLAILPPKSGNKSIWRSMYQIVIPLARGKTWVWQTFWFIRPFPKKNELTGGKTNPASAPAMIVPRTNTARSSPFPVFSGSTIRFHAALMSVLSWLNMAGERSPPGRTWPRMRFTLLYEWRPLNKSMKNFPSWKNDFLLPAIRWRWRGGKTGNKGCERKKIIVRTFRPPT